MMRQWRKAAWMLCVGSALAVVAGWAAAEGVAATPEAEQDLKQAVELLDQWDGSNDGLLRARAIVDRVLQAHPDYANAYRVQGWVQLSEGGDDGAGTLAAMRSAERAIQLAPDEPENYLLLARIHRSNSQWPEAEAALTKAEQLGADPAWVAIQRGRSLADRDRYGEAAIQFEKVLSSTKASTAQRAVASNGMLGYYNTTGRLDEAERVYRAQIEANPTRAWNYGNYAAWLLCWREDGDAALVQVRKARALADYGHARMVETGVWYDRWSAHVLAGRQAQADEAWQQAQTVAGGPADPALLQKELCGGPMVTRALKAMRTSGKGARIPAGAAVMMAADKAPAAVPGLFVISVQASGRSGEGLFLNSEKDYRDQRNLSVHLLPKAQEELRRRYRQEPDTMFNGMVIQVLGWAQRTKIGFFANGQPSGSFYYQTHVVVDSADQIEVLENQPSR